jgi:hypothetical protein
VGDCEAKGLGGLEVDDQLELHGLLHGQVSGLGPLGDLVHVCGRAAVDVPPFAIPSLTQPVQEHIPHVGLWGESTPGSRSGRPCPDGCASVASGATRRPRARVTIIPMVRRVMVAPSSLREAFEVRGCFGASVVGFVKAVNEKR